MKKALFSLAWGLATAALIIATPLRAVASNAPVSSGKNTIDQLQVPPVSAAMFSTIPTNVAGALETARGTGSSLANENGAGWDEVLCAACVGAGAYALFTGGAAALPVLVSQGTTVSAVIGACINVCESAIKELLK